MRFYSDLEIASGIAIICILIIVSVLIISLAVSKIIKTIKNKRNGRK